MAGTSIFLGMTIFKNRQPDTGSPVSKKPKEIKETKCTCQACGNVWYYGKQERMQNTGNALMNGGKSMMCCSGCVPALLIPDKKVIDLNKCPTCGSKAIVKEVVTHYV